MSTLRSLLVPGASREELRRLLAGYLAAIAAVSVVSLFIGLVLGRVNLANVSMLYLLAVLATAVGYGRGPAVFSAVSAFLVFDWFFVEPVHQFTVTDPEEWVSLLFFLLTAIVTGQLAAGQRERAREARQREREALVLYDVVRLLDEADLSQMLTSVAERLRRELHLQGLSVELWLTNGEIQRFTAGETPAIAGLSGRARSRVLQRGPAAAAMCTLFRSMLASGASAPYCSSTRPELRQRGRSAGVGRRRANWPRGRSGAAAR